VKSGSDDFLSVRARVGFPSEDVEFEEGFGEKLVKSRGGGWFGDLQSSNERKRGQLELELEDEEMEEREGELTELSTSITSSSLLFTFATKSLELIGPIANNCTILVLNGFDPSLDPARTAELAIAGLPPGVSAPPPILPAGLVPRLPTLPTLPELSGFERI